jgi:rare lipoprotein A
MRLHGDFAARALARLGVAALACVLLANCSQQTRRGGIDPKLGVTASPRVVEPGQPVPKGGGVYRVGKPYVIGGKTYYPEENARYRNEGLASWYGEDFHGRYTANREVYDMESISAAHPTLPLPSYVRVTNLQNRKSLIVRVNDRGPYHANREIDLSAKAADLLGFRQQGTTRVRVEYVGRAPLEGSDDRKLLATLRDGEAAPAPSGIQLAYRTLEAVSPFRSTRPVPRGEAPVPQGRPYDLGQDDRIPSEPAPRPRTYEARALPPADRPVRVAQPEEPAPALASAPVSAYAPQRAVPNMFSSGRGLY